MPKATFPDGAYFGKLCLRGHDSGNGKTLRYTTGHCVECTLERERRRRKSEAHRAYWKRYRQTAKNKAYRVVYQRQYQLSEHAAMRAVIRKRECKKRRVMEQVPDELREIRGRQFDVGSIIKGIHKQVREKNSGKEKDVRTTGHQQHRQLRAERHVRPDGDASGKARTGQRGHGVSHKKHAKPR